MNILVKSFLALSCVATAAGTFLIGEPVLGLSEAEAKTCQAYLTSRQATATNLERAKRRARRKYKVDANTKYGWQYNSWHLAENRSYIQSKKGVTWRVRAKARPCKA